MRMKRIKEAIVVLMRIMGGIFKLIIINSRGDCEFESPGFFGIRIESYGTNCTQKQKKSIIQCPILMV